MKNYYEILGIDPDATEKEIRKAYARFAQLLSNNKITNEEFTLATEAYTILSNEEYKTAYDKALNDEYLKELEQNIEEEPVEVVEGIVIEEETNEKGELVVYKNKSWFAKHKTKLVAGGLAITMFIVGYAIAKTSKKNNNINNTNNTSSVTDIQKEELVLNINNFDETVSNIVKENKDKGLYVKEDIVNSALLLVNLNNLSDSDLSILANNIDMQTELQNLLDYVSMVESHNLNNEEKISLATLAYDKVDREILTTLDTRYNFVNKNIEKMEDGQIADVMNEIYEFTIGSNGIQAETGNYFKLNLGDGAGLISESYVNLIANEIRNVTTNEYKKEINAISDNTNGIDYINGIYKTEIPCLEEKTLVK